MSDCDGYTDSQGVPAAGNAPTLVEIPAHRRSASNDLPRAAVVQLRQRQFLFTLVINSITLESLFMDKIKRISNLRWAFYQCESASAEPLRDISVMPAASYMLSRSLLPHQRLIRGGM